MSLRGRPTSRSGFLRPRTASHRPFDGIRSAIRSGVADRAHTLVQYYYELVGPNGCDLLSEDWDNLVILDACRYDVFEQLNTIPGELSSRRSKGSATVEFLERNFSNGPYDDIVYVTAHPNVTLTLGNPFHELVNVWKDEWNHDLKTVPPAPVTRTATDAYEEYPNKRLIVHYLQPHYPFIGEIGRNEIDEQAGVEYTRRAAVGDEPRRDYPHNAWNQVRRGTLSVEVVRRAYRENLELVLPYVERLVERFDEKTVVTADHGNLFGERPGLSPFRLFEHPVGVHVEELVKVPWLVVEGESRKDVIAERSERANDDIDPKNTTERLRQLGYRQQGPDDGTRHSDTDSSSKYTASATPRRPSSSTSGW